VEGKDKLLAHKWDFFCKHVGYKKVNGNMGFNVKEKLCIIPKCVSMPRTKKPLLHASGRTSMYDWHMGWWKEKKESCSICNFPSCVVIGSSDAKI
jgi:hypothetical protein